MFYILKAYNHNKNTQRRNHSNTATQNHIFNSLFIIPIKGYKRLHITKPRGLNENTRT